MSGDLPRWAMGDPAEVCERMEGMRNKHARREGRRKGQNPFEEVSMTRDESDQIEDLLIIWFRWAKRYRPALGAPRVSPYGRGVADGGAYGEAPETIDERLEAEQAQQVDVCLNSLSWQQRAAVGIHAANREARSEVYKNPRLTAAEQHAAYQEAKEALLPMLIRRGLICSQEATRPIASPSCGG